MTKIEIKAKIIAATLEIAAAKPWRDISLEVIAETAGFSLAELSNYFKSKLEILDEFNLNIDRQIQPENQISSMTEPVRDQLFEILMARFDALQPHKIAIKSIYRETVPFDPIAGISGLIAVTRSMKRTLDIVGIDSRTPLGCLTTKGLVAVYLRSFNVWLSDDSLDVSKTMAALDANLAHAEKFAIFLPKAA